MADMMIFDSTFYNLQKAIDNASRSQAIIAHNIANANTPGYVGMDFDKILGKAVRREDGRGIIIEEEMASLAENNIEYSAYIKLVSSKINILKTIVTQGRR